MSRAVRVRVYPGVGFACLRSAAAGIGIMLDHHHPLVMPWLKAHSMEHHEGYLVLTEYNGLLFYKDLSELQKNWAPTVLAKP
jgi:hypothetical protein